MAMCRGSSSPRSTSGESYQKEAVSVSTRSRTTSQLELRQGLPLEAGVGRPDRRVLPHHEEALELARPPSPARSPGASGPCRPGAGGGSRTLRPLVAALAVVGLEQADDVLVEARPPAAPARVLLDVLGEAVRVLLEERHGEVAGQDVVERRDVGRALDRGVAAQRQDAAARPADVAQQELEDRGGADHLHAGRVLGPADGVADGAGLLRPGGREEGVGDVEEGVARHAADPLDDLRGVARRSGAGGPGRRTAGARASGRAPGSATCCASPPRSLPWPPATVSWPAAERPSAGLELGARGRARSSGS